MFARIRIFLEMIKFSHTVFALPFVLLSAALASERVGGWRMWDLVGILLCMVFARTAAMAFNRWADRAIDAENPRTAIRAIPSGQLSSGFVLGAVFLSGLGFVLSTAIFWFSSGNTWPMVLSLPTLAFLLGYSYAKRFTAYAHVWLGLALALSPVAAWLAITGRIDPPPIVLGLAILFWVTGFDILYACQDIEADRRLGLHSIPAWLGFTGAMWVARISHALMVAALVAFGWLTEELGTLYGIAVLAVACLLLAEHWLVRDRSLARVNLAFLYVNGTISIGLMLVGLAELYLLHC